MLLQFRYTALELTLTCNEVLQKIFVDGLYHFYSSGVLLLPIYKFSEF